MALPQTKYIVIFEDITWLFELEESIKVVGAKVHMSISNLVHGSKRNDQGNCIAQSNEELEHDQEAKNNVQGRKI